jgi:DNA polymerase-3 subunit alpha
LISCQILQVSTGFVHLHVHSEYSLADGIASIKDLVAAAAEQRMPAVAITDIGNTFGLIKFYRAAVAGGIKPIVGVDIWVENVADAHKPYRLVLLCQDLSGYRNLCHLLTHAYREGQHSGRPCVSRTQLYERSNGLIALSGAEEGEVGQALLSGNPSAADTLAQEYASLFPDRFYLMLQRIGQRYQEDSIHGTVALAQRTRLPVVATNQVCFLRPSDYEAHEVRVCIQDGRVLSDNRRPRRHTQAQFFRSANEMAQLFADVPEALENTVEIAKRCNLRLEFGRYFLPDYPVPPGVTIDQMLSQQAHDGLQARVARQTALPAERLELYHARLRHELEVIAHMGFSGYFLIVADFIRWAKDNGIPVGPGRGSGAGSLVAYSLSITDLDPLEHDLLFERFLNPERVSLPDFDVDFCMEKRDRVIEYVMHRYGEDRVAQIITYGTMAARAVVRDVGRVMDHPYGYVDQLAKLIPFEIGVTLDKALVQEPILRQRYEQEEDVRALLDTARALEGLPRNAGKHAGGVVIAPSKLTDFMPLYCEQGGKQLVTQFDKDDLEALGLVKFDFLGLRNLTTIDKAVKSINIQRQRNGETPLEIAELPLNEAQTYALLKSCKTTALFQLESRGMKELIQRLQPDNFEEIVALVALFRPGPLQSGMVDDFIARKHGRARIEYPHASLEPILKPTYGVILYQEQVMQIAQVLSGYSLGKADVLRAAMGKKKPEEMARQREGFINGAVERGVNRRLASHIFDLIEKFAGYGFNRSHSAAYALIAYQTAWLKAHYPAAFMAAVLSADMDNTDKVVTMIAECRDMELEVSSPDINRCEYEFVPRDDKTILYGLGAIKGLGQSAIDALLEARRQGGTFKDLFDLCKRVDLRRMNRRVLESLIRAGAFDSVGPHRATLMATLGNALRIADQQNRNRETGQNDLFALPGSVSESHEFVDVPEWSEEQRLEGEKETLGFYLSGHPIERFAKELAQMTHTSIAELKPTEDRTVTVAGLVVATRTMRTRRGDRMIFVTLDDRSGRLELAVFSELYMRHRELLVKDNLLVVEGPVSVDEYTGGFKMSAEKIYNFEQARAALAKRVVIDVDIDLTENGFVDALGEILNPASGGNCPVHLRYQSCVAEVELALGEAWRVSPSDSVLERLVQLAGADRVHIIYP